jgi:hypothetical protein
MTRLPISITLDPHVLAAIYPILREHARRNRCEDKQEPHALLLKLSTACDTAADVIDTELRARYTNSPIARSPDTTS